MLVPVSLSLSAMCPSTKQSAALVASAPSIAKAEHQNTSVICFRTNASRKDEVWQSKDLVRSSCRERTGLPGNVVRSQTQEKPKRCRGCRRRRGEGGR